jgi:hypothetical protein
MHCTSLVSSWQIGFIEVSMRSFAIVMRVYWPDVAALVSNCSVMCPIGQNAETLPYAIYLWDGVSSFHPHACWPGRPVITLEQLTSMANVPCSSLQWYTLNLYHRYMYPNVSLKQTSGHMVMAQGHHLSLDHLIFKWVRRVFRIQVSVHVHYFALG